MKNITAKLGTMRKAAEWTVYPAANTSGWSLVGKRVVIQSDTRIAEFNTVTGVGLLSKARSNGAYFIHLNPVLGATPITVSADVIAAALAAQPASGDELGPGVFLA